MNIEETVRLSRNVYSLDLADAERAWEEERANCLTPTRARTITLDPSRRTDLEEEHIANCAICTSMLKICDEELVHPSWWELMRYVLGMPFGQVATTVKYHLEVDTCRSCIKRHEEFERRRSQLMEFLVAFRSPVTLVNPSAAHAAGQTTDASGDWLDEAMQTDQYKSEKSATNAYQSLGFSMVDDEVLSRIVELTHEVDGEKRLPAMRSISYLGERAATPQIQSMLLDSSEEPDPRIRQAAADALGNLGQAAINEDVRDRLRALTRDSVLDVQVAALGSLKKLYGREFEWKSIRTEMAGNGLEVRIVQDGGKVIIEFKTKQDIGTQVLGCGFRGEDEASEFLHFLPLDKEGDWYTGKLLFDAQEFHDQVNGRCEDLLVMPFELTDLNGQGRGAILKSIEHVRDDEESVAKWRRWFESCDQERQPNNLGRVLSKIQELLGQAN